MQKLIDTLETVGKVYPINKNKILKLNIKGETPLHQAAKKGDITKCESILHSYYSDISAKNPQLHDLINARDFAGWTALHEACNHGNHQIIPILVHYGASINAFGHNNETPLHDCIANNHIECARSLLNYGADQNIKNDSGLTPYDYAYSEEAKDLLNDFKQNQSICQENFKENISLVSLDPEIKQNNNHKLFILTSGYKKFTDFSNKNNVLASSDNSLKSPLITDDFSQIFSKCKFVEKFDPSVSHLVTFNSNISNNNDNQTQICAKTTKRTLKYLMCVLSGKWIVSDIWLHECIKNQNLMGEIPYEIEGCITKDRNFSTKLAPIKGRIAKENKILGLFHGLKIYLKGQFEHPNPSKSEILTLIKLGQGQIIIRDPSRRSFTYKNEVKDVSSSAELNSNQINPNSTLSEIFHNCKTIILLPISSKDNKDRADTNINEGECNILTYLKGFYYYDINSFDQLIANNTYEGSDVKNHRFDTNLKYYKINPCKIIQAKDYFVKNSNKLIIEILILDIDWLLDSISQYELIKKIR
ncbi:unnamed protein product [Gordionus sp. m RMFG-2023]